MIFLLTFFLTLSVLLDFQIANFSIFRNVDFRIEKTQKSLENTGLSRLWRRERDSNPCGLAPKRFSRPPRYDRFDIPPCIYITHCLFIISYFLFFVNIMLSIYSMELKKLSIHEISYHCKVFNFTTFYIKTYFILKELFSNVKIKIRIFSFSSV